MALGILETLQGLIAQWVGAQRDLTADTLSGSDTVKVRSNYQYEIGEEVVISSLQMNPDSSISRKGEMFKVKDLPDFETIILDGDVTLDHEVANEALIVKTLGGFWPRTIQLGDKQVIPDYPAFTISADNTSIEWLTLDSTSDEFNFTIMVYIRDDNSEDAYRACIRYADLIKEALMNNLHPIIDKGSEVLTTDLSLAASFGDTVLAVDDASMFVPKDYIVIRDLANADQNIIKSIISPTEIELERSLSFDFPLSRLPSVIRPRRWIYDSRIGSVNYGTVQKGSAFLKAAEISWWCKEERIRQRLIEPKI